MRNPHRITALLWIVAALASAAISWVAFRRLREDDLFGFLGFAGFVSAGLGALLALDARARARLQDRLAAEEILARWVCDEPTFRRFLREDRRESFRVIGAVVGSTTALAVGGAVLVAALSNPAKLADALAAVMLALAVACAVPALLELSRLVGLGRGPREVLVGARVASRFGEIVWWEGPGCRFREADFDERTLELRVRFEDSRGETTDFDAVLRLPVPEGREVEARATAAAIADAVLSRRSR